MHWAARVGCVSLQGPSHKDRIEQHLPNHPVAQRHVTALQGTKSNRMERMSPYHTSERLRGSAGLSSSAQFPETQANQEPGTPWLEGATPNAVTEDGGFRPECSGATSPPSSCVAIPWASEPGVFSRHPTSSWKSHVAPPGTGNGTCGTWVRRHLLWAAQCWGRTRKRPRCGPPGTALHTRPFLCGRAQPPLRACSPEHVATSPWLWWREAPPSSDGLKIQSTWDFRARPGKRM